MKILSQTVSGMYVWSIALISLLDIISGYTLHAFPAALIVAVAASAVVEIVLWRFYLKRQYRIPFSGLITGLIIGSVAPINAPLLLVLLASIAAILSKFFIKFKGTNILNPASIGLIAALALFGMGDEWWAASTYNVLGVAVSLTPILIVLAYEARRIPTALSFAAVAIISQVLLALSAEGADIGAIVSAAFSINYFLAFVMLIEPKTSPHARNAQIAYGIGVALMYIALPLLHVPYFALVALLAGNLAYFAYRKYFRARNAASATGSVPATSTSLSQPL